MTAAAKANPAIRKALREDRKKAHPSAKDVLWVFNS